MKATKATKRSLLASGLALLACVALLAGTTFAWFTDSVVNSGNRIQAGTLDIVLVDENGTVIEENDPIFEYERWEPGYSTYATFGVKNNGTLAVKYQLTFVEKMFTQGIEEVLDVYLLQPGATAITEADKPIGTVAEILRGDKLVFEQALLEAGQTDILNVAVKMREGAGNPYQGAIGLFDIQVVAGQAMFEQDGFDSSRYDETAEFPEVDEGDVVRIHNIADLENALANQKDGQTWYIAGGEYPLGHLDGVDTNTSAVEISANNLTILGVGNPVLYGNVEFNNANLVHLLNVSGDNVKIDGVTFMPLLKNGNQTMVVDSHVRNFTITNCTFTGNTHDENVGSYSYGALYFIGAKDNVLVEGNTFDYAMLTFDSMNGDSTAASVQVKGNTFNVSGSAISNVTWSTPAVLTMQDVLVEGNTFNMDSGEYAVNVRFGNPATGMFRLKDNTYGEGLAVKFDKEKYFANQEATLYAEVDGETTSSVGLKELYYGSNKIDPANNTISNMGYVRFSLDRDLDLTPFGSKADIRIYTEYSTDNGGSWIREPYSRNKLFTEYLTDEDTGAKYPKSFLANEGNIVPAGARVSTNETKVGTRYPDLYAAVEATTGEQTVQTRQVLEVYNEQGFPCTYTFGAVTYSDGGNTVSPLGISNEDMP